VVIKDIVTIPSNGRRFFLATFLFIFHKFTGTDSLNYFAPEIFEMIGVQAGSLTLLTTGVYGLVKLATTVLYVAYIVDRVGRRRPLLVSDPVAQSSYDENHNLIVLERLEPYFKQQLCCILLCTSDLRILIPQEARQLEESLVSSGFTFTLSDGGSIRYLQAIRDCFR
jgi:MFS family permease